MQRKGWFVEKDTVNWKFKYSEAPPVESVREMISKRTNWSHKVSEYCARWICERSRALTLHNVEKLIRAFEQDHDWPEKPGFGDRFTRFAR